MKQLLYLLVGTAFLANIMVYCVRPPDYPIEPVIAFEAFNPGTSLQQPFFRGVEMYADLTFTFTDGDGDIGFSDSETSLIIRDTRQPNIPLNFILPMVPPEGAGNGISGTVIVKVPITCCIPDPLNGIPLPACDTLSPSMQMRDTVVYSVQIKDRAGHLSNVIEATPMVLICRK